MNHMPLQNKVALVSCFDSNWISSLIGPLMNNGAHVALITDKPLDSLANHVQPDQRKCLTPLVLNIDDLAQADKSCADILGRFPKVDILVNAPIPPLYRSFLDTSPQHLSDLFQQYLGMIFTIIRAAGKSMLAEKSGKIINIVSGLARRGLPGTAAYSSSQAAILGLTRSLALEWAPFNINVNAIGIGWLSTVSSDDADFTSIAKFIPLRYVGHPNDIEGLLLYLSSPISGYITGTCINVDGGLISHA